MGRNHLCQHAFLETIQTEDLTLDGGFPCVHSPVPLLGTQGDPGEVSGEKPKGRSGLPPSALWPHGGAAALRSCTARGSTGLSGVRPRGLTCRLGMGVGGGGRGLLSSPGGRCRGGAGIRGEERSGALPRV